MFISFSRAKIGKALYQEGPPNLDEIFKKMFKSKGPAHQAFKKPGDQSPEFTINLKYILLLLLILWTLSGIIIVKPAQKATVLRFGRYYQTLDQGVHWVPSLVSSVFTIDVNKIHSFKHTAEMLTKDENIVDVSIAVWYKIQNPRDYLFSVANPNLSLREASASALRQVIGHTELDQILTTGRNKVMEETKQQLLEILNRYNTGIEITELNLLPAKPPEAVTAAFDDAIKAREDEQRYINQAMAYAEKVEPIAIGRAARLVRQATADATQITLKAEADVAPFVALIAAHQAMPELTNTRLYFTTLAKVLSHVRKIITNDSGQTNLFFAPSGMTMGHQQTKTEKNVGSNNTQWQKSDAINIPFSVLGTNTSEGHLSYGVDQGRSNYSHIEGGNNMNRQGGK